MQATELRLQDANGDLIIDTSAPDEIELAQVGSDRADVIVMSKSALLQIAELIKKGMEI